MTARKIIATISLLTLLSIALVATMFILSEKKMYYDNDFIRRFPDYTAEDKVMDLTYDSYYYAGTSRDVIYLGNVTAPLVVTEINTALRSALQVKIKLEADSLPFRAPEIRIFNDDFYFIDGTVPVLFKGRTGAWEAKVQEGNTPDFFRYQMLDSLTVAYNFINPKSGQRNLGAYSFGSGKGTAVESNLLEKQVDGMFDVEGHLHYDLLTDRVIFLYQYRNSYIVADKKLKLLFKGKTIDTISRVALKSEHVKSRNEIRLVDRPITVNQSSAVYGNLLFVQSLVRGRYEASKTWEVSSVIDVYNIEDNAYISSFYVYDREGKKLRDFFVIHDMFYGFIGKSLVRYRLSDKILKNKLPAGTRGRSKT